jgi:hypothetical protein
LRGLRDLFAPQTRRTTAPAARKPGAFGRQLLAPIPEKFSKLRTPRIDLANFFHVLQEWTPRDRTRFPTGRGARVPDPRCGARVPDPATRRARSFEEPRFPDAKKRGP